MKINIVFFIILIFFCECSLIEEIPEFDKSIWNVKVEGVNNLKDAQIFVAFNINYKSDIYDEWQLPLETLKKYTGDCEDKCILLISLIYTLQDEKSNLICIEKENGSGHALIRYKGKIIESGDFSNKGIDYKYKIIDEYTMEEIQYMINIKK